MKRTTKDTKFHERVLISCPFVFFVVLKSISSAFIGGLLHLPHRNGAGLVGGLAGVRIEAGVGEAVHLTVMHR
jgi:hypothetical protein